MKPSHQQLFGTMIPRIHFSRILHYWMQWGNHSNMCQKTLLESFRRFNFCKAANESSCIWSRKHRLKASKSSEQNKKTKSDSRVLELPIQWFYQQKPRARGGFACESTFKCRNRFWHQNLYLFNIIFQDLSSHVQKIPHEPKPWVPNPNTYYIINYTVHKYLQ